LRIDYVFHSEEWRALDARIRPWDGESDHRPVLVRLAYLGPGAQRGVGDGRVAQRSDRPASREEVDEDDDQADDQQDVDEAAKGVAGNQPQQPQHQQDDADGHEHGGAPLSPAWGPEPSERRPRRS